MPLPHLLPNILFPSAFTNNVCPNHSQGRGLRGRGHPTSWWGKEDQKRVLGPVAHLSLWQTHLGPRKDTFDNSYTLMVQETLKSHRSSQTVYTPGPWRPYTRGSC